MDNIFKANRTESFGNLTLEKEIDELAEEMSEEAVVGQDFTISLLPRELFKAKVKEEIKEKLLMREVGESLSDAFNIIVKQGKSYLSIDEYFEVIDSFEQAFDKLMKMDANKPLDVDFQELMGIEDKVALYIEKIAMSKHKEEDYFGCSRLFILLTILIPSSYSFWNKLGVSFQELKDYKEALKAYGKSLALHPSNIPAWLFMTECHVALSDKVEALQDIDKIEIMMSDPKVSEKWGPHFELLKEAVLQL